MQRILTTAALALLTGLTAISLGGCPGNAAADTIDEVQSSGTDDAGDAARDDAPGSDGVDAVEPGNSGDAPVTNDNPNPGTGTPQDDGSVVLPPLTLTVEDGDVSGDGVVNGSDLQVLVGSYGAVDPAVVSRNDLDGDGDVDITDLALLVRIITELVEN